jgi:tetratricopeptide (TPR) repeat protein
MALSAGTRLGPYEILAPLGVGGMGEVYRARDTKLNRDVAIKVIADPLANNPDHLSRFEREAQVLAALNHPHIAHIYGFEDSTHVPALAMELVEGPTLADRIAHGALPIHDALAIAAQIADALEAAHARGIVHRDLKPANVKVKRDGTVKVLDFGLAKSFDLSAPARVNVTMSPTLSAAYLTEPGVVLGTAAYMSPEQARGQAVDPRTDIWSFGCVLYEMLTGRRAFKGSTAADTIAAILAHQPDWNALGPVMPAGVEQLIQRCLEKKRDRRIGSAHELRGELEALRARPDRPRRISRGRIALATLAAVLVALITVSSVGSWRHRLLELTASWRARLGSQAGATARMESSAPRARARRAIAVMGLQNLSRRSEAAWLSPALSETLTMELASGGELRAIPGESVARMKIDLAVSDVDSYALDTLSRIRKNIGVDVLVLGSYLAVGRDGDAQIRLDLRLQDATTGEVIAAVTETGNETDLLELVSRTGGRLRQKLGVGALSPEDSLSVHASLPSTRDVMRLYAEGLEKLRLFDALAARELFERAVAAEPDYALTHAALASAWSALGYDAQATAEAKKALGLAGKLSHEQRLAIEATSLENAHDWNEASKIYKALWTVFPDNLEYGLGLAAADSAGGHGKEALAVVDELRALPPPANDDPRIDLAEAFAAGSLSDFKRQEAAAKRAGAKGQAQGARLLVARARLSESLALYQQGQLMQAEAASQEARGIFIAAGDRAGGAAALKIIASVTSARGDVAQSTTMQKEALEIFRQIGNKKGAADTLNNIAIQLKDDGDLSGARTIQEQVLAVRREIADRSGTAVSLNNLGVTFFELGNFASARRMYEESLSICRETGDKRGEVRAMLNLGIVLMRQGDLAGAKRLHEESLAIRREIGDKRGAAVALINLADVLSSQGDLVRAAAAADESLAIGRETDSKRTQGYALFTRGGILEARGRLEEARKAHEEALAIREQLRETLTIVESRIRLAGLAIEEGKAQEAEALARSTAEASLRNRQPVDEILARTVLARARLAQGQLNEARKAIAQGSALLARTEYRQARLELRIVESRVDAASGRNAPAMQAVESIRREAAQAGLVGVELEARLAFGEIETASGAAAAGRNHLESLRADASAKGFLLIARKAGRRLQQRPEATVSKGPSR